MARLLSATTGPVPPRHLPANLFFIERNSLQTLGNLLVTTLGFKGRIEFFQGELMETAIELPMPLVELEQLLKVVVQCLDWDAGRINGFIAGGLVDSSEVSLEMSSW